MQSIDSQVLRPGFVCENRSRVPLFSVVKLPVFAALLRHFAQAGRDDKGLSRHKRLPPTGYPHLFHVPLHLSLLAWASAFRSGSKGKF
jgi:hypothetical protein